MCCECAAPPSPLSLLLLARAARRRPRDTAAQQLQPRCALCVLLGVMPSLLTFHRCTLVQAAPGALTGLMHQPLLHGRFLLQTR
jgi:hypothetical protein